MSSEVIAELLKDRIKSLAEKGKRGDGRGIDDYREIHIEKGVYKSAEGSARVTIGETEIIAGIKLGVGEPFPDMPNSGVLTTSAELIPLASPTFESGPPDEDSIELARVVDRGIRESGCIDLQKLCITEKEKVWVVFIDLHVLDYDGNLFDTASLAALTALLNARMPKLEGDEIIYGELTTPLPIAEKPIATTFVKLGNAICVDPSLEEEEIMDARLTAITTSKGELCAMQKSSAGLFSKEEVLNMVDRSIEKGRELRRLAGD